MSNTVKSQSEILKKLKIAQLNPMQTEAINAIIEHNEVLILSPTGSGKTLAFLLPIIANLDPNSQGIQTLILTPSRELAIQIEQVFRDTGSGYKVNAVYGGIPISKDKLTLKTTPSVLIGTPGRILDHINRETFSIASINTYVLDEFDKSLEVGFEEQMKEILNALIKVKKKILCSATQAVSVPEFVQFFNPVVIDYSKEKIEKLELRKIVSEDKDKLGTLLSAIKHIGDESVIVFCNYKDSIQRISDFLEENNISHGCFHGGMEQSERERCLIKFRNGSHKLIIATDLAARGLDVPSIKYIIHYHLPHKAEEFTHRNGRTARMNSDGISYVLVWKGDILPDFIPDIHEENLTNGKEIIQNNWKTIFISGGRKDKISKGDIVGLCIKQGGLAADEIGSIELKQDCAFVAIKTTKIFQLLKHANNAKLKKKKVRLSLI